MVDGRHGLEAVPPLQKLLRFLLKQLLSLPGHGLTGFLVTGNDLLKVIHIVGFNAVTSAASAAMLRGTPISIKRSLLRRFRGARRAASMIGSSAAVLVNISEQVLRY